ncbi:ATPase [Candidatus Magnetomorum sp. HK-1]|nr:ATPase [Candidatus Magnetomorum sp. HK-1]
MKIERIIISEIQRVMDLEKVIILKGARQVGKTTIMEHLISQLEDQNKKTFYISADEDFDNSIFKTPHHFISFLESKICLDKEKSYVFIDEFQYIKEAGIFLKVLYDKYSPGIQFIVSGSSSLEITKNCEFLTGRKIEFHIHPISFQEYVSYKEPDIAKQLLVAYQYDRWKIIYDIHKNSLEILFAQYAQFGSYPEILTTPTNDLKKILLRELFSTYIQKDIIAFLRVENISAFNHLLKILCSEVSHMLNKDSLAKTLRISINTLNKYLDILEGTYVCAFLSPFHTNARKEVSKMKKIFLHDNGLKNYLLNRFPVHYNDLDGQDAENIAYTALRNHVYKEQLYYYRTLSKSEIDFIVDFGDVKLPIEIKFRKKVSNIPIAMVNFKKKHQTNRFIVVTKNDFYDSEDNLFIPLPLFEFYLSSFGMN